jgi:uncharacterized membrane protein
MRSRASVYGHPIHPILITIPIGLWVFSLICDLVYFSGVSNQPLWRDMAFYTMAAGVIGALVAAVPGFIDYLSIRNPSTKRVATAHMILNLLVTAMFIFNLGLRLNSVDTTRWTMLLSAASIAFLGVAGWLGGNLVYRHRVGIDDDVIARDRGDRAA